MTDQGSSGSRAVMVQEYSRQGAMIDALSKSVDELRREQRETMTMIRADIKTTGDKTLEAIKVTAGNSAVREQISIDTLTEMNSLALVSEEREKRREARELVDLERKQKREDEDRVRELKRIDMAIEQEKARADDIAKLRRQVILFIIAVLGALGIAITAYFTA